MVTPERALAQYGQYSEAEAREAATADGYNVRITRRDAEYYVVTADYQPDRVNFEIENNRVVAANFG